MRKKLIGLFVFASVALALMIPALGFSQQRDPQGGNKGRGAQQWDITQFQQGGGMQIQPGAFDQRAKMMGGAAAQFGGFGQGGQAQFGGFGQPPGGKGGKGGKGQLNIGGMNLDVNTIFNELSKGQDSIAISNAGPLSMPLMQWSRDNGNTSGYVTRQQFNGFVQTYMTSLQSAIGGGGAKGGKGKGDPDAVAAQRFKGGDKNGDGLMSPDEMSAQLRDSGVWKKYDRDGNGVMNLEEYKTYWREKTAAEQGFGMAGGKGNQALNTAIKIIEEEWEQRPVVFRPGKLPPGLPKWFMDLDTDRDAQVGLYEWKTSQKTFVEFQVMDRNGDSLLTAEEVLWHIKAVATIGGVGMTTASFSQSSPGMQGMQGFQNGNFGFGNKGNKGGKKGNDFGGFGGGGGGGGKKGGGKKGGGGGGGY